MKYALNLVRTLRATEKKHERRRARVLALIAGCFSFLGLALFVGLLTYLRMITMLNDERQKLSRVEAEYKQYTATNAFIDKSDIELLDRLMNNKIFWTRKIAAMAQHLPEHYWITKFGFKKGMYSVDGYGYITADQEQLVTIDEYLNLLRKDRLFNDVFKEIFLISLTRKDEEIRERISFSYNASPPPPAKTAKAAKSTKKKRS